jgi:predicted Zn-dependent protease
MPELFRYASPSHSHLRLISALLLCLGLSGMAAAQSPSEPFHFGKVDMEFLDQIKQVDKKFEDRGLIYHDPELNAYVERVGQSLIKGYEQMENVNWRFRIFRDPSINAFAFPTGSIYINTGLLALVENEARITAAEI